MFAMNQYTSGPVYMLITIAIIMVIACGMGVYYVVTDYLNGALDEGDMRTYPKGDMYHDLATLSMDEV